MRQEADWMGVVHERVLEHLDGENWSTPRLMARERPFQNLNASAGQIREKCELLARAGLVEFVTSDIVGLTGAGRRYLAGELDGEWLRF
jgi:hypothetical protein